MKKAISLILALTLCMGLTVPAFAAETTIDLTPRTSGNGSFALKVSDLTSWEVIEETAYSRTILCHIPQGTTVQVDFDKSDRYVIISVAPAMINDATGEYCEDWNRREEILFRSSKDYPNGYPSGTAITMNQSGLWKFDIMGDMGSPILMESGHIFFEVDGGAAAPSEPSTPAEPVEIIQPVEPVEPAPVQPTVEVPADAITYTVQKYDTMGQIALNNYGSYAYHKALTQANAEAFKASKGVLKPGMTLILPATLGNAVRLAPLMGEEGESFYTVQPGDTLGSIAAKTYGNVNAYKAIFERNSDRLKDANTIYAGQVIVLPTK